MYDALDGQAVDSDVIVVMMTAPDAETAERIAIALVDERLAACCNVIPGVRSIYRWEGDVERASESLVIIKTVRTGFDALRSRIIELHPYDVPEVIAVPLCAGDATYLAWLRTAVGAGSTRPGNKM